MSLSTLFVCVSPEDTGAGGNVRACDSWGSFSKQWQLQWQPDADSNVLCDVESSSISESFIISVCVYVTHWENTSVIKPGTIYCPSDVLYNVYLES